jgi:ribose 5-phosphate isomerase B
MKIALGADHAGYKLKEELKVFLKSLGHEIVDKGAFKLDPGDDYPDFVFPVARAVASGEVERGIVIGKSGEGEAMCANRVKGVRASIYLGGRKEVIFLSRQHNDANVLSLSTDFVTSQMAHELVPVWLKTAFSGESRHIRRIKKLDV